MAMYGSGDYVDIMPAGTQCMCPACGAPCPNPTAAKAHCQKSYNSKTCPTCKGSGEEYGNRCKQCGGTGRVPL